MISSSLLQICNEFEGMMLSKLLPPPVEFAFVRNDVDGTEDSFSTNSLDGSSQLMGSLFSEAFALAIERAGGVGLGRELATTLSGASK